MATTPDQPLDLLTRFGARLTRRDVLRRAVALGLSAPVISALLAACGGDDDDDDDEATATTTGGGTTASPTTAGGGATATTGGGGATGGTLVVGETIEEVFTLDPSEYYEIRAVPAMFAMYQPLIYQDYSTGEVQLTTYAPMLAEEVPSVDNGGISADGLTYTVKLRKGVKFHTGNEMTADDVVFCIRRLWLLKKNPSFLAEPFSKDDQVGIAKVDDYTVKFTLLAPNAAFLSYMAGLSYLVYDSKVAKENGALDTVAAETDDKAGPWFLTTSIGTGPFKLGSFKSKEEIVLDKFADYWGEGAGFDKVVYRHITDAGSRLQQLEAGEIDIALELDSDGIKSLDGKEGFQVVRGNSLAHTYLGLHHDPTIGGIVADKRVRQAIAQTIDYDGIAAELLGGAAVRPATPVPLGLQGADKVDDKKWQENIEAAKALITEADVEGQTVTLTYGSSDAYDAVPNEVLVAKLKADIERCGIKVELVPEEPQQRLQDYRDAKLQFTVSAWSPDYVDVHTYAFPFGGVKDISPSKRIAYVDEENTATLDQAIKELDPVKREALYVEVMERMIDDAGFIVLWQPVYQVGMKASLTGYRVDPVAQTQFWTIKGS